MCLVVYLGTDARVAGFEDVAVGEIGLGPAEERPVALERKRHVAMVASKAPTGLTCGCVFRDDGTPWGPPVEVEDEDRRSRAAAYAGLRQVARAALAVDPVALLFSCWDGDEDCLPDLERVLSPEELVAGQWLFDDVNDGGSGGNPPVLIRLTGEGAHV